MKFLNQEFLKEMENLPTFSIPAINEFLHKWASDEEEREFVLSIYESFLTKREIELKAESAEIKKKLDAIFEIGEDEIKILDIAEKWVAEQDINKDVSKVQEVMQAIDQQDFMTLFKHFGRVNV